MTQTLSKSFLHYRELKRVIAYCLRFKDNACNSTKRTNESLTVQEMNKALILAIRICQASEFHQELRDFRNQRQLESKNKILNLHPFLDSDSIIRVGERLWHVTSIEYSKKYPIILPNKHYLTELIVRDTHYRN